MITTISNTTLHKNRVYRGFLKLRFDMKLFIKDYAESRHSNGDNSQFNQTYRDDINGDIASLTWILATSDKDYQNDFVVNLKHVMDITNSDTNNSTLTAKDIKPFIKKVNLIIDYLR